MKKPLIIGTILVLFIGLLLVFYACHLEESYKEFSVKNIADNSSKNNFDSDELAFSQFQNIVIIPEIKAINHEEYIIYITALSRSGTESIKLSNLVFKEGASVLLSRELGKEIRLEENAESIYEGWTEGGTFTDKELNIASGKKYILEIGVAIAEDGVYHSENVKFEVTIKGYKSLVFPT